MSKNVIAALVVVIALAGAAAVVVTSKDSPKKDDGMQTTNTSQSSTTDKTASSATQTNAVTIQNFAFSPATIKVKVGDTVTWINQDSTQHSVIANTASADAPNGSLMAKGETYKFTFNKAGTYAYHCGVHPSITGTVTVE